MHVQLISKHAVNFPEFLKAVFKVTGEKISDHADKSVFDMSPDKKLASCLSSLVGLDPERLTPAVMCHLTFSTLVMVYIDDLPDILGMSGPIRWLGTNTTQRGIMVGVMTGDLQQWKDAVDSGTKKKSTQEFFQLTKDEFVKAGYGNIWNTTKGHIE